MSTAAIAAEGSTRDRIASLDWLSPQHRFAAQHRFATRHWRLSLDRFGFSTFDRIAPQQLPFVWIAA